VLDCVLVLVLVFVIVLVFVHIFALALVPVLVFAFVFILLFCTWLLTWSWSRSRYRLGLGLRLRLCLRLRFCFRLRLIFESIGLVFASLPRLLFCLVGIVCLVSQISVLPCRSDRIVLSFYRSFPLKPLSACLSGWLAFSYPGCFSSFLSLLSSVFSLSSYLGCPVWSCLVLSCAYPDFVSLVV
jgi:hypothetical protein